MYATVQQSHRIYLSQWEAQIGSSLFREVPSLIQIGQ